VLKSILILIGLTCCSIGYSQGSTFQLNAEIEDKITQLLLAMSVEEKIGQTCQITLDAVLKTTPNGTVLDPFQLDEQKLKEALITYHVGSILNVSSHTLSLSEWRSIHQAINKFYSKRTIKIPIIYGIDAIHGLNYTRGATLFPHEIGLAATWNRDVIMNSASSTAYEMRASGLRWNFSPVLDLGRQPLWSRYFETLGEDPFLASELGEAFVNGYQGNHHALDNNHVIACLKHFVGYSLPQSGRDRTPAWIPENYMTELFLPPFKAAVDAGALTVMVNSGSVNGVPGHANYHLLTEILKHEWGFKGFVVSDWEDFSMLETVHQTASSYRQAIAQAFNAGVDMSMVPNAPLYKTYCLEFQQALSEKLIDQKRLDDAVRRILRVKYYAGLFDEVVQEKVQGVLFGSSAFKAEAEKAALESITLLKNSKGILPLSSQSKILLTGPTANSLNALNGAWTHTWQGEDTAYNTVGALTLLEAFKQKIPNLTFNPGAINEYRDGWETSRLVDTMILKEQAVNADVIVLCLGELPGTEKPGDIRALDLPEAQLQLARCAIGTGKPVVILLIEGRPRTLHGVVEGAAAVLQLYLPGDYGATACLKILYGDENPSGKLPYTYPKYSGIIEHYDHPKSVDKSKSNQWDGFDPEWEFGFGLSYTSFEYSNLSVNRETFFSTDTIRVSVDVKNTGSRSGKEVVQLYVSDLQAQLTPAVKRLKGFQKIYLMPGETKEVNFLLPKDAFNYSNNAGKWIIEPGLFRIQVAGLNKEIELK
jgi:beta-glucosidase